MGHGSSKSSSSDESTGGSRSSTSRRERIKQKLHLHRRRHAAGSHSSHSKLSSYENFAGIALVTLISAEMKFKDKWLACISIGEQTFRTEISDQTNKPRWNSEKKFLLERNGPHIAKISVFEPVRRGRGRLNDTHVTTAVPGTIGHIAPEYLSTGKCSEKTDVFGYGMMLLELITGQRAFDLVRLANDDDVMLLDWAKGLWMEKKLETLVDADLKGNYVDDEVEQLIQAALLCTQGTPLERPKMSEVVRMLEGGDGLVERWEEWQKEEMFRHEFIYTHNPNTDWIIFYSTYNLRPDELSSPR